MPLRVTHLDDKGQVAVLNKWADWIEGQLKATSTKIFRVSNTAVAAIPPAPPTPTPVTVVPTWPLPNTAIAFMARAIVGQTGLQTIGDASTAATSGGFVSISNGAFPSSSQGVAVPFSVGNGGGGGYVGWTPINISNNLNGIFRAGRNCKYQARIQAGASVIGVVIFLGFSTSDASDLRTFPFTSANNYVGIYAPGLGSSDNWHATIDGSSVDTGVPVAATATTVEIIMNDTANTTSFSINGNAPTVISSSNPSGFNWSPTATFANANSVALNFTIEYFYAQQDF